MTRTLPAFLLAALLLSFPVMWMGALAAPPRLDGELARLEFLLGEWSFTDAYLPEGGEATGTYRAEAGPGGHSILVHFGYDSGPFAGMIIHEVITWDAAEKAYKGYAFVSTAPGCFVRTGRWEEETFVFSGEMVTPGGPLANRHVYVKATPELVVIETSRGRPGGPLRLAVRTTATKK